MEKLLKTSALVRFQDCDPFNHLNNSKYIDYFLNAREDQIEKYYGLNIFDHFRTTGNSWVVGSSQVAYIKPANTMEKVVLESKLIDFNERTILVEMKMLDVSEQILKSICWMRFVYVQGATGRSASQPAELLSLFDAVKIPVLQQSFEERSAYLISEQKRTVQN